MDPRMRGSAMGERLPSGIVPVSDIRVGGSSCREIEQTMQIWIKVHMGYHLRP